VWVESAANAHICAARQALEHPEIVGGKAYSIGDVDTRMSHLNSKVASVILNRKVTAGHLPPGFFFSFFYFKIIIYSFIYSCAFLSF